MPRLDEFGNVIPEQSDPRLKRLANEIAARWKKQTNYVNVIGSVQRNVYELLPTIIEVLEGEKESGRQVEGGDEPTSPSAPSS